MMSVLLTNSDACLFSCIFQRRHHIIFLAIPHYFLSRGDVSHKKDELEKIEKKIDELFSKMENQWGKVNIGWT